MKYLIILLMTIALSITANAKSRIEIDNDTDDCIDGWISMDIEVKINGEDFDFNPSCKFSFSDKIKTKSGLTCKIEAGMCSAFSPQKEFHVDCDDGSDEEINILCPPDN